MGGAQLVAESDSSAVALNSDFYDSGVLLKSVPMFSFCENVSYSICITLRLFFR